ncbi:MAG TPA: UDP-N-acetylmuramate:L-alanyl-gamma-D-glutamyl-meso-diaminopimelate ligase [Nitrospiria bacterium]|nr:UDP-N-acetylmuramate:L-alanyl-gamma-D-glutamyl-meso-diaminopimelate ligase [Nitrospiria bacterium]
MAGPEAAISGRDSTIDLSSVKNIHLVAVCGTGMGSLAGMLKASGYRVTGSDQHVYPPMSTLLEASGIGIKNGFSANNLDADLDLVIIGNAVSRNNPEVQAVLEKGLPYLSFPEAVRRFFLERKEPIVIAGTHGKTTTSSLAAWVLQNGGKDPGFMIGGFVKNFEGNYRIGKGPYFVVEGDEYDSAFFDKGPKFLHYAPQYAILTSIEFDHGDIYKDLSAVKEAFKKFVNLVPSSGKLFISGEDRNIVEILNGISCPVESYGIGGKYDWTAEKIVVVPEGISFEARYRGDVFGEFLSPLMGNHNLKNSLAVIALSRQLGLSAGTIREGLSTFLGVKRRQEIVGESKGVSIMDDFAHHPTAIDETIEGIKMRFPDRRLWVIFEPRSATSRRNYFQKEFSRCFDKADRVIIARPYALEKIAEAERLDPEKLVKEISGGGPPAALCLSADEIVGKIAPDLRSGDIVCVMSSGGFDGIHGKILKALETRGS